MNCSFVTSKTTKFLFSFFVVYAITIAAINSKVTRDFNPRVTYDITPADVYIRPVGQLIIEPKFEINDQLWEYTNLNDEKECLAKNLYFEARGQPLEGQLAVALVTINRVKSARFPNSICNVVWQQNHSRTGKLVAQFSWTLDGKSDVPVNTRAWNSSYRLADVILSGGSINSFYDFTDGALFYHAVYVAPYWKHEMELVTAIGDHIFYKN